VDRPLHLLFVAACPFPARRGTPLRIERMAGALARRGHRVEIAAYAIGEAMRTDEPVALHQAGPFVHRSLPPGFHLVKLSFDRALARLVERLLARGGFDLVHAHHVEGVLCAASSARRMRLPLVYDAHTMLESELPTYRPALAPLLRPFGRLVDRMVLRRSEGVVAVTPDIRAAVVRDHGFAPERVVVALNGVEVERFRPEVEAPTWRVCYTGTLAGYQDVDLLLRAFARARREVPELRLVIATGDDARVLRTHLADPELAGAVEVVRDDFAQLPDLLASCGVAVLPRRACPGLPQKLLNYMAAGRAVVASAGSAKVIEPGRTGLVVPDGDEEAFARALVELAREPRRARALGRAARAWVEANASWEATARRVEELYVRLLPATGRAEAA